MRNKTLFARASCRYSAMLAGCYVHSPVALTTLNRCLGEYNCNPRASARACLRKRRRAFKNHFLFYLPRSRVRTVIHISDAPCHGCQYHERNIWDNYPGGDPEQRSLDVLLHTLRVSCRVRAIHSSMMRVYLGAALMSGVTGLPNFGNFLKLFLKNKQ